jgi:hypothetical protein
MTSFTENDSSASMSLDDYLEEDEVIPGQNFYCISSYLPEHNVKERDEYKVSKFLEYIYRSPERTAEDIRNKLRNNRDEDFSYDNIHELYEDWKFSRDKELDEEFHQLKNYETTVNTIKIRGVYSTQNQLMMQAKRLHKKNPNFGIMFGMVGKWCLVNPDMTSQENQERQLSDLNELAKRYYHMKEKQDENFERRKRDKIERANLELEERKRRLREEMGMNVPESSSTDVENIRQLRKIVDTGDRTFYENQNREREEKERNEGVGSGLDEEDPWLQAKKRSQQQQEQQEE